MPAMTGPGLEDPSLSVKAHTVIPPNLTLNAHTATIKHSSSDAVSLQHFCAKGGAT